MGGVEQIELFLNMQIFFLFVPICMIIRLWDSDV